MLRRAHGRLTAAAVLTARQTADAFGRGGVGEHGGRLRWWIWWRSLSSRHLQS
jgi:hypothetical protein